VGPKAGLDGYEKSGPSPGFDPWTVQSEASRELSRPIMWACTGYSGDYVDKLTLPHIVKKLIISMMIKSCGVYRRYYGSNFLKLRKIVTECAY
jgi:hypothetical protein